MATTPSAHAYAGLTTPGPLDPAAATSRERRRVGFSAAASGFPSNQVCTSRYTWWSFVPLFLLETFAKTANIYFLLVGVFQAVPSISPTGGVPTQLFPLAAVVFIDAAFAALEDLRRHRDDATANAASTTVFCPASGRFEACQWRDVRVGDVLRLVNHETVPADAVLLATQAETGDGICFVETKSLDGESNLKRREAPRATRRLFDSDEVVLPTQGYVDAELPNADVHTFAGVLHVETASAATPLSIKNVLLRGSKLRNADVAYALVVNTGSDCKVLRGDGEHDAKMSSLDALVNRQVRIVVVLLVVVCVVGAAVDNSSLADLSFASAFVAADSVDKTLFESLAYYLTILCDLVPITLYVTITIVRALQSYFMAHDLTMYDAASDTPLVVRSMQLNEQLGQITHVFADKTGTLTCNEMVLRKCTIHGTKYENAHELKDHATTDDPRVRTFFTHMALCHSVLIEHGTAEIEYSAASPDEQALVGGARDHGGVAFVARGADTMTLRVGRDAKEEVYHVLEVFEFTSARKRMTVVVRKEGTDADDQSVLVLTKGSESVLFSRLALDPPDAARLRESTQSHLTSFAHDGLRTLVFASKRLSLAQWDEFHARYQRARADHRQVDAQAQGLANDIDALEDEMERGLDLLGATAIEDRLQDGVPEAIAKLRVAGIAVWMLTGDMLETAVNIGLSCHLLDDSIKTHVIRSTVGTVEEHGQPSDDERRAAILQQLDDVYHTIATSEANNLSHAIVIDGASLLMVLRSEHASGASEDDEKDHEDGAQRLLRVVLQCRAVIACRVSPSQKAQLVELVQRNVPDAHTLAIGDGANDVPMLRTAHVGVGIAGQEGRQAVNCSDYAFAQFRFLLPLLFVHGRWNYNRVAGLIGYTFYKNIVYSLSLNWFCLFASKYSGSMLYSPIIQQLYNLIFTALPIGLYATQDMDLPSKEIVLQHPELYHPEARRRDTFTHWTFWSWVTHGVVDSVVLFLAILAASIGVMRYGETAPLTVLWSLGWTMLVSLVTARFCVLVNSWTVIEITGVVFSLGSMLGVQILFDAITWGGEDFNTYSFPWLLARPHLWLGIVLAIAVALIKDVASAAYIRRFRPRAVDLIRESLRLDKAQQTKAMFAATDLEVVIADLERLSRPDHQS